VDERWGAQYWMARRSPSAQLRIGHAERERTAEELKQHTHAGRLELHEFEERVGKAFAAKTQADLAALTVDLPPLHPVYSGGPNQRPRGRGFFHYAAMAALSWYVSLCVLMIFLWAISGTSYFWPIWVIVPWGVMLLPALLVGRMGRRRRRRATWY
jgi:hypothetical protein